MEKTHEKSNLIPLPELTGLWEVPNTQESIIRTYYEMIETKGTLDVSTSILKFETGAERDFIDLSKSYVEIKFKVVCTAQNYVKRTDQAALTNLFAHGLFSNIKLTDKSGRALSNLDEQNYPYQAMLLTLLEKTKDWAESAGPLEGFYKDDAGKFEVKSAATTAFPAAADNKGFFERHILMSSNAGPAPDITVIFRPFLGIMRQQRLMLNNMGLRLSLTRAKPEFTFISHADVPGMKAVITSAKWFVQRVELTPAAINFNVEALATKGPALYPIDRIIFYQQEEVSKTQFRLTNIWSGPMPSHVILAIVKSSAYAGIYTENPYNFKNFTLSRLQMTVGSREIPEQAFAPDFKGESLVGASVSREFLSTLEIAGKAFGPSGNLIDLKSFVGGNALYAFDLTADGTQGSHWSLTQRGSLSISGTFKAAPPHDHPVTIIVIGLVTSVIEIYANRNITSDFTD